MAKGFNENANWEESVGLKTTAPMRDRLQELASQGGSDDYDRAVLLLLKDFASLKVLVGVQADKIQRTE